MLRGNAAPHSQFLGLVIHHTVTAYEVGQDPAAHMRWLQRVRPDLGSEIPYSFVIFPTADPDGCVVAEGRGFGRTGAHTVNYNSTAYGVAFAGNYENDVPTPGMLEGVRWIGRRLADPINALATIGHRETGFATACPGAHTMPLLGLLQPPYAEPDTEPNIEIPEEDDMQLTDTTTAGHSVNDILNWTIEGINRINARLDALEAARPATGGASAKEIADELAARLRV